MLNWEYFTRCPASPMIEIATFDRSGSIAATVMMSGTPLLVGDLTRDARFRTHPDADPASAVAFAGVPVRASTGVVIGSLCVRDTRERQFTREDVDTLELIAGFISREVEFCDLCTVGRRADQLGPSLPLTGRSVLIVAPPGLSRDVMHDWLTNAGALVDAASAGAATAECLSDSAIVGVPYSVIVLDAGLASLARDLRSEGCTVPIVAFRPPSGDATSPEFAGCTTVLPTPIERGTDLVEACRRASAPKLK